MRESNDILAAFGVRRVEIPDIVELEEDEIPATPAPAQPRAVQWDMEAPRVRKAKRQAQVANVGAHRRGSEGRVTQWEWLEMLEECGWKCLACGMESDALQMSHIRALAKGGEHVKGNVQPLCKECVQRKGLKIMDFRGGST